MFFKSIQLEHENRKIGESHCFACRRSIFRMTAESECLHKCWIYKILIYAICRFLIFLYLTIQIKKGMRFLAQSPYLFNLRDRYWRHRWKRFLFKIKLGWIILGFTVGYDIRILVWNEFLFSNCSSVVCKLWKK